MQDLIRKAMRCRPPVLVKVQLPSHINDWYEDKSDEFKTGLSVLIRGVLVDFYDRHHDPDEEVSE